MEQQFLPQEELKPPTVAVVATSERTASENTAEQLAQQSDSATETIRMWLEYIGMSRPRKFDGATGFIVSALLLLTLFQIQSLIRFWQFAHANTTFHWEFGISNYIGMACSLGIPLALLLKLNRLGRLQTDSQVDLELGPPDVRWVGSLAEALTASNPNVRSAASRLLTRLLPRMRSQDAALLNTRQRQDLYRKLRANDRHDTELILAILKALERVGDAEAISYVESLAEVKGWLPRQRCVREAAFKCLSALEARLIGGGGGPGDGQSRAEQSAVPEAQEENVSPAVLAAQAKVRSQIARLEEQSRKQQPAMRLPFLIASYCTFVPYTFANVWNSVVNANYLQVPIWTTLFILSTQIHRLSLLPGQKEAARKLAEYDDIAGVGPLAESLEWPDEGLRNVAADALAKLLPRLRASDAGLLNARQRACLYRRLDMRDAAREGELIRAILTALEQVGDEAAVPYVQRLAESAVVTPYKKEIRQAAQECLPFLKERAAQLRASQMLLRPSGVEETGSAALLRPAAESSATDPAQLLRANTAQL